MSRLNSKRWVYLIGSPASRLVKIGVSSNPAERLADLQVGSPIPLMILWRTQGGQGLESALHRYFRNYRVHGEWFDFGEESATALVATAAVLLGYRTQPEGSAPLSRYRRSDCTACAGRQVEHAVVLAPAVPAPRAPVRDGTRKETNLDRVLSTVRALGRPVRQKDVADACGLAKGTVSKAVKRLIEGGRLVRLDDGLVTVQGTYEGLDAARARGARLGRPPAMTEEQIRHARDLLTRPENTVTSIAEFLGVSRNTIYKYVPELKGGKAALAWTASIPELPRPTLPTE